MSSSIFVVLFMGMGARLLPTWMFLNSMQLIAHTPLLNTYMPSNLHYFLIKFLNLVRIFSKAIDETLEGWQHDGLQSYEMTQNSDSLFSSLLKDCGYKYAFSSNLILIIGLAIIILIVLGILFACDLIRARKLRQS